MGIVNEPSIWSFNTSPPSLKKASRIGWICNPTHRRLDRPRPSTPSVSNPRGRRSYRRSKCLPTGEPHDGKLRPNPPIKGYLYRKAVGNKNYKTTSARPDTPYQWRRCISRTCLDRRWQCHDIVIHQAWRVITAFLTPTNQSFIAPLDSTHRVMNTRKIWAEMANYFRNSIHKRTMALCHLCHDIVVYACPFLLLIYY